MLKFMNKKDYVQSVAKDVAPKLCAKFGKKNTYSFHEISWVLNQINRSNDRFYKSVSYGMLLPYSKELALELHEDLGDLLDFQKSVGKILDWSLNNSGSMYGGFSMRYIRDQKTKDEQDKYDQYVGVKEWMPLP